MKSSRTRTSAYVARVFDVSRHGPGFHTEPFSMRTGPFGIDCAVDGRIVTIVRPGLGAFTMRAEPYRPHAIRKLGHGLVFGPIGNVTEPRTMVGLGDDGTIWMERVDAGVPLRRDEGWERVAPDPGGAVTAMLLANGRLEVVAVAPDGRALRLRDGRWAEIGGRFTGSLELVPASRDGAHVAGIDGDGRLLLGSLDVDWRPLGDGAHRDLQALAVGETGLALLAIDRAGRVHHAGGPDPAAPSRLTPIEGPKAVLVGASPLQAGGVEVAIEDETSVLHVLAWPGWPSPRRRPRWERLSAFDELASVQPLELPCPSELRIADPCGGPAAPPRRRRAASR